MSVVGKTIRILREASGKSRADFANAIGITYNYLSMIENGQSEPGQTTLKKISKELNLPLSLLLWHEYETDTSGNPRIENIKRELKDMFWEFISVSLMKQNEKKST